MACVLKGSSFRVTAPPAAKDDVDAPPPASNSSGIKVKKIKRGYSDEADKLLDYIVRVLQLCPCSHLIVVSLPLPIQELGVQDALDKSYLKSLIFAIYLDPEKPNDIIECYTFNFSYSKSADGTSNAEFEMEIRNQMNGLSISGKAGIGGDMGLEAMRNEAREKEQRSKYSLGAVKRKVQTLVRR